MDLLFASDKPWVWKAEKKFARLKLEYAEMLHGATDGSDMDGNVDARYVEGSAHLSAQCGFLDSSYQNRCTGIYQASV